MNPQKVETSNQPFRFLFNPTRYSVLVEKTIYNHESSQEIRNSLFGSCNYDSTSNTPTKTLIWTRLNFTEATYVFEVCGNVEINGLSTCQASLYAYPLNNNNNNGINNNNLTNNSEYNPSSDNQNRVLLEQFSLVDEKNYKKGKRFVNFDISFKEPTLTIQHYGYRYEISTDKEAEKISNSTNKNNLKTDNYRAYHKFRITFPNFNDLHSLCSTFQLFTIKIKDRDMNKLRPLVITPNLDNPYSPNNTVSPSQFYTQNHHSQQFNPMFGGFESQSITALYFTGNIASQVPDASTEHQGSLLQGSTPIKIEKNKDNYTTDKEKEITLNTPLSKTMNNDAINTSAIDFVTPIRNNGYSYSPKINTSSYPATNTLQNISCSEDKNLSLKSHNIINDEFNDYVLFDNGDVLLYPLLENELKLSNSITEFVTKKSFPNLTHKSCLIGFYVPRKKIVKSNRNSTIVRVIDNVSENSYKIIQENNHSQSRTINLEHLSETGLAALVQECMQDSQFSLAINAIQGKELPKLASEIPNYNNKNNDEHNESESLINESINEVLNELYSVYIKNLS